MTAVKTKRLFNLSLGSVFSRDGGGPLSRGRRGRDSRGGDLDAAVQPLLGPDRIYVVEAGDSLSRIAERTLGDAARWSDVFDANKDKLEPEGLIHVGQALYIPEG